MMDSDRLIFTRFQAAEFEHYAGLMMHPDVMRYITGEPLSQEQAAKRFQKVMKDNESRADIGWFGVYHKLDQSFVGLAKLVDFGDHRAEAGYALLPAYWGQRYASEMLETMVALAKEVGEFDVLIGVVDPENAASIRILEKQGFIFYESLPRDGETVHHYRLLLKQ